MEKHIEYDGEKVCIDQEWYESLIEFRTKYITLTNYLLSEARLGSDGKLSIYINVADILCALEYAKTYELACDLQQLEEHKKKEEGLPF